MRRRISATPRLFSSWTGRRRPGGDDDAGDDVEVGHDDDDDDIETSFNFVFYICTAGESRPPFYIPPPSPGDPSHPCLFFYSGVLQSSKIIWYKFSNQLLPNVQ